MNRKRAITLRLDEAVVDQIDAVRSELGGVDRTTWLRRAVRSQLEYAHRILQDPAVRSALQR